MSLREVIEQIRKLDEPPNEEATKFQIVLPILRSLGWDFTDPSHVQPERRITATDDTNRDGRVDLALLGPVKGNQTPSAVALIEVKKASANLRDKLGQMLRYAFDDGAKIFVLTNGFTWWLFLPREHGSGPLERRFAELDLRKDRLDKLIDEFTTYLAWSELTTQRAERCAKRALNSHRDPAKARRDLEKEWRNLLDRKDEALFDSIASAIFKALNQRLSSDQICALLRGETLPMPQTAESVPTSGDASTPQSSTLASSSNKHKEDSKTKTNRPVAFTLFGERRKVKRWNQVWSGVVEMVYERHHRDLGQALGKPGGRRSYIDLDSSTHLKSQRLTNSPYYIDLHGSGVELERRSRRLLEIFGHSPDDLQFDFDEA